MIFLIANWLFNGLILTFAFILGTMVIDKITSPSSAHLVTEAQLKQEQLKEHMAHLQALHHHATTASHAIANSANSHSASGWLFLLAGYSVAGIMTIIGLTDIGRSILRVFLGARYAINRERNQIEPLLNEVIEKVNITKGTNYKTSDIKLLIKDIKEPNAHAFGKDTIILTTGMLEGFVDNEEMKAVLAHEMGHIYYKDTIKLVGLVFGSLATRLVMWVYGIYVFITGILMASTNENSEPGQLVRFVGFFVFCCFLPILILNWVGGKILDLSLKFVGRKEEYRADKFAKELGYMAGLIRFLEKLNAISEHDNSLFSRIIATHPVPMKRIGRLEDGK